MEGNLPPKTVFQIVITALLIFSGVWMYQLHKPVPADAPVAESIVTVAPQGHVTSFSIFQRLLGY